MTVRRNALAVHRVLSFALLSLCALLGSGRVSANDLLKGDLLVGAAVPEGFGLGNGAILLVRNGAIRSFARARRTPPRQITLAFPLESSQTRKVMWFFWPK